MGQPVRAPRPWRASGIVTLLTDYGLDDPYVGIVKGVLHRDAPRLTSIVDLTHAVPPGDVATAGFLLERSWSTFPAGTVHVAVVDPGVGTERAILLVEARGHVFLAPDNGLVAPLIASEPLVVVRRVGPRAPVRGPSTTFDGRDRFAPLAARLVEGDPPATFGDVLAGEGAYERLALQEARRLADGSIAAEIVHVDRFGNLITNAPFVWLAEAGADWRTRWRCRVNEHELAVVRTYADAPGTTPVALSNSYDRMEIAVGGASAARVLGLARGAAVRFVPVGAGAPLAVAARALSARKRSAPAARKRAAPKARSKKKERKS